MVRTWRLYRIPLRQDTVQFGTPNIRRVRSLRITMLTPDQPLGETEISLALARMSFVGAPWLKRAETPIAGIGGLQGLYYFDLVSS